MDNNQRDLATVAELSSALTALKGEIAKVVIGQRDVIDHLLACFLSQGHCLIVGVPGLAKTTIIQSLARSLSLRFNRIQFTPDLMPSDITGSEILFDDKTTGNREFRFVNGPLFSNIVLADEINRTPPKTQSALLQAMQEREVTSSGRTYALPSPFWVLATQNPIEQEGTYPLPEAQQDRFMFSLKIGYPDAAEEAAIARMTTMPKLEDIRPVVNGEMVGRFRDLVWRVPVADSVVTRAVKIVRCTRPDSEECPASVKNLITWGAGPRASQYLVLAAKAFAAIEGRPTPDASDIDTAAYPVLRHRIVRSFHAEVEGIDTDGLIGSILAAVKQA
jgi:MoxR-like ATPase